ncbi:MAG: class I SAM-dependent RNA methyltransferase [Oscillospiraceae bacterium]|nr:class I SAM-dependent RNA methyltransferase [Oscillospiraceae bacterium]
MIELVATCLFGLEGLLGEEIDALGYERISTIDGRVTFRGDISAISRCNIFLRYAERVLILVGSFPAESFDALFEGTKALGWTDWIGRDDAFPVTGHSIKSRLTSIPDCQKIVKKAIVESMKPEYGISVFPEEGIRYRVEFFILNDTANLMIDTSGAPLHKRGYRPDSSVAPIRETLAAAMAKLARPREEVLFWDPMCGSGTIPIEAALIMTNTAPGMFRDFAAEEFYDIPDSAWKNAREEARSAVIQTGFEAYASDISPECVKLTEENIRRAGMQKNIKAFCQDALKIETGGRRGTIVCNPPYGERLMSVSEAEKLYSDMGHAFSASALGSWQIYVITSCEDFERLFGRRADKKRRLYNGMIKCTYYQFFRSPASKMAPGALK